MLEWPWRTGKWNHVGFWIKLRSLPLSDTIETLRGVGIDNLGVLQRANLNWTGTLKDWNANISRISLKNPSWSWEYNTSTFHLSMGSQFFPPVPAWTKKSVEGVLFENENELSRADMTCRGHVTMREIWRWNSHRQTLYISRSASIYRYIYERKLTFKNLAKASLSNLTHNLDLIRRKHTDG